MKQVPIFFICAAILSGCGIVTPSKEEIKLEDEASKPYSELTTEEKNDVDKKNKENKINSEYIAEKQKEDRERSYQEEYNLHLNDHIKWGYILPIPYDQMEKIPAIDRPIIEIERQARNNWKTYCVKMKLLGRDVSIYQPCHVSEDQYARLAIQEDRINTDLYRMRYSPFRTHYQY